MWAETVIAKEEFVKQFYMKKGILILALGHPYYGKMAAALAATLRCSSNDLNIHLAYCGNALNHLSSDELSLFCSTKEVPSKYYMVKDECKYIRTKVFMYDLSPFDETIFLDADVLWLKKSIESLFNEFENVDVTFSNFGTIDTGNSLWANIDEVKAAYNFTDQKFYKIHSELVYFKKNKVAKQWFKDAQKVFDNLKVQNTVFAGSVPDELPFAISSMFNKIYPHQDNFKPLYWMNNSTSYLHINQIAASYYGIGMAGPSANQFSIDNYNIIVTAAYNKLKLQNPYSWKNKKSFLKERKSI